MRLKTSNPSVDWDPDDVSGRFDCAYGIFELCPADSLEISTRSSVGDFCARATCREAKATIRLVCDERYLIVNCELVDPRDNTYHTCGT